MSDCQAGLSRGSAVHSKFSTQPSSTKIAESFPTEINPAQVPSAACHSPPQVVPSPLQTGAIGASQTYRMAGRRGLAVAAAALLLVSCCAARITPSLSDFHPQAASVSFAQIERVTDVFGCSFQRNAPP